jgi:Protein-disulfide isomerase
VNGRWRTRGGPAYGAHRLAAGATAARTCLAATDPVALTWWRRTATFILALMPQLSARRVGALAITAFIAAAACARPDASSVRQASGEVSLQSHAGGLSGLTDSVSTMADQGRIRGAASAPVWVIEISDFQCPYCKQWHDETFVAVDREYVQTGKVRLAYLNFPLTTIHPHAQEAAEAAMCASVQNKFWELHDSLFGTQRRWETQQEPLPIFDSLAVAAGVKADAWRKCMSSHATAALIQADHDRASQAGVRSTPSFFIGGHALEGAYPADSFRVAIDQALAAAAKR